MLGLAYFHQGKLSKAVKELEKEIQLHSSVANHYTRLAALLLLDNNYEIAINLLNQSLEIDSNALFTRLVYYLVLLKANKSSEAEAQLEEAQSLIKNDEWIAPVIRFYAGEINEDAVLEAAVHNKCYDDRSVKCEAYYYLGMAYLLGIRSKDGVETTNEEIAKEYFQKCIDTEARNFWEYELARVELHRLEGDPNLPKRMPFF